MDASIITATTGLIGAVVALLGALGGGVAFLIRRADKKRELGEALLLEHLRGELRKAHAEIRWLQQVDQIRQEDGNSWRDQLLLADIQPEPKTWSRLPDKPEETQ